MIRMPAAPHTAHLGILINTSEPCVPQVIEFYTAMQRKQSTTQRTQPPLQAGRPIAADENSAPGTIIDKSAKILKLTVKRTTSKPAAGAHVLRQTQPRAAGAQSQAML